MSTQVGKRPRGEVVKELPPLEYELAQPPESVDVFSYSSWRRESRNVYSSDRNDEPTKVDLAAQAQNSPGIPAKAGGVTVNHPAHVPMARADAEEQIAGGLTYRRWKSRDLVSSAFRDTPSIENGTVILFGFLQLGVLEVGSSEDSMSQDNKFWVDACLQAASDLRKRYEVSKKSWRGDKGGEREKTQPAEKYFWKWTNKVSSAKCESAEERDAAFFNVIGVLSCLVACYLDAGFQQRHPYRNRFATFARKSRNIEGVFSQESKSDIFTLPLHAFCSTDLTEQGEACTESISPLEIIRANIADKLQTSQRGPQDFIVESPSPPPNSRLLAPTSQTPFPSVIISSAPPRITLVHNTSNSQDQLRHLLARHVAIAVYLSTTPVANLDQGYFLNKYACFQGFGVTGEVKTKNPGEPIRKELVYMQQQGLAQPHLKFVLGIAKTEKKITFVREDAIGTEEVTLEDHRGSDVLEVIRLALGLGVATPETLGAHPGFELGDDQPITVEPKGSEIPVSTKGFDSSDQGVSIPLNNLSVPESASCGTGRKKRKHAETTAKSDKRLRPTTSQEHWGPSPAFFNIDGKCYFLDYLAHNLRSITGRQTRVWCAYIELKAEDIERPEGQRGPDDFLTIHEKDMAAAKALLSQPGRGVFVGPYALKIQYADMDSPAMLHNIVETVLEKMKEDPDGSKYLLLPQWQSRGGEVMKKIRGFQSIPAVVEKKFIRRQEITSVSLFKRTLDHYCSLGEICRAVVDAYQAILWLHRCGFVHRDVSDSNLLLAREQPTTFSAPTIRRVRVQGCEVEVNLVRRKSHEPKGVFGLIHDLDMAALVSVQSPTPRKRGKDAVQAASSNPTLDRIETLMSIYQLNENEDPDKISVQNTEEGTPPFMSIRVLIGSSTPHSLGDDAESLFYVPHLFPFHRDLPAKEPRYPCALPLCRKTYPVEIRDWTGGPNLKKLGSEKLTFFLTERRWQRRPFVVELSKDWTNALKAQLFGWTFVIDLVHRTDIRARVHELNATDAPPTNEETAVSGLLLDMRSTISKGVPHASYDVPGIPTDLPNLSPLV